MSESAAIVEYVGITMTLASVLGLFLWYGILWVKAGYERDRDPLPSPPMSKE